MTTAAQRALIEKIARALESDERIAAAWLSGSIGRGAEDEWSDVDVLVLVQGASAADVGRAYAADTSAITETVYTEPLYGGHVVNCITPDWQRFDLSFIEAEHLSRYDHRHLKRMFNKGALEPGEAAPAAAPPASTRVLRSVREFIRILGLLPLAIGRDEYVNALTGVGLLRTGLIDLMIEDNGIAPPDRGGALHLNRLLTAEQRAALEALPPLSARRESIIANNVALTALFSPLAKSLCERLGIAWPHAYEHAARRHVERSLGVSL